MLIVAGKTKAGRMECAALPACKANLMIYLCFAKSEKVCKSFDLYKSKFIPQLPIPVRRRQDVYALGGGSPPRRDIPYRGTCG